MKSVKFWRTAAKDLSLHERIFFRDAIRTLLSWDTLKEEYSELDLIKRVLESEIHISTGVKTCYKKVLVTDLNVKLLN